MDLKEYIKRREGGQLMSFMIERSIVSIKDIWELEQGYLFHLRGLRVDNTINLSQTEK